MKSDKNTRDKDLQKMIFGDDFDSQNASYDFSEDAELYKLIGENLKEEPSFSLGINFAEMTTKKAMKRKRLQVLYRLIFAYLSIALSLIAIGGLTFYFLAKDTLKEFMKVIPDYSFQIVFFVIILLGIQLVDKLFIRKDIKSVF